MNRIALLLLIFISGYRLYAQNINSKRPSTYLDDSLIKKEKPYEFHFGHFFADDTLYAILLETSNDNKKNVVYCNIKFFEKVNNKWRKKNEYDSLQTTNPNQTRFGNYSNDTIKDYLISAGIVGTGANETEYLFILDRRSKSLKLIKGFENIPSTSYNGKSGIITAVGLAAGIPSFEYFEIVDFKLIKLGGKQMWSDDLYGYLEKYKIINGKKIVYYKNRKKLPVDFYNW